jgi:hypothetical protein
MGKIKDTVMYPVVAPAGDDIIIGTDKSDSDITKNFTVQSIADLVSGTSKTYTLTNAGTDAALRLRLSDGTTNNDINLVPGTGINLSASSATSATINLDVPVTVDNGGTGLTAYSAGDILYASNTTEISKLRIGSTGEVLQVSASGIPEWVAFTPGVGTVTSVGPSNGTFISSSSPAITSSGTLQFDLSATGTPSATTFLRGDNTWATPVAGQIPIENAGSQITSAVSKINFTGAGVTATNSGNDVTVDVPLTSVDTSMNVGYEYSLAFIFGSDLNNVRIDDQRNLLYNAGNSTNKVSLISDKKAQMQIRSYTDTNTRYPSLELFRHRGTKASPSSVLTNDIIGGITFNSGYSGSNTDDVSEIFSRATEDHTNTATGSELVFGTKKNGEGSSVDISEKMILGNDGNLEVQQVYTKQGSAFSSGPALQTSDFTFDGDVVGNSYYVLLGGTGTLTVTLANFFPGTEYYLHVVQNNSGSPYGNISAFAGYNVIFPFGASYTASGALGKKDLIMFKRAPGSNDVFATVLGYNYV